jgi:SpoVK/Ycf46/Vps4 family AAA+-type ATPase
MEHLAEIKKIVEAGLQEDSVKVCNYTKLLIDKLFIEQDESAAKILKSTIRGNKTFLLKAKNLPISDLKSPVDSDSRLSLVEVEYYELNSVFLSVSDIIKRTIEEYIELINKSEQLTGKNIKIYRGLLMYGPPGVGKTQTAKYISSKTNLPLVTVRIDGLISSYLGNTSKNIRKVFDFVKRTPCILFLDDFDSIAKMRDDSNELGELKRVVNTLLQNIDSIINQVPIIAATNHQHLLDPAVWRRFDYRISFYSPTDLQRLELINAFLDTQKIDENTLDLLVNITSGLSGSEIENFCNVITTNLMLEKIGTINEKSVFDMYILFKDQSNTGDFLTSSDDFENIISLIKTIRQQNKKFFNYRLLSKMSGISIGKISKTISEGER